jgi:uncharacterized protein with von Willebrand factor type A (vWA) domain
MFPQFFFALRRADVPVSLREYLDLMAALDRGLAQYQVEDFYFLSRALLVKDERHLDRFDQVFGHVFRGLEPPDFEEETAEIPEEWLRKMGELVLTEEEKAQVEALGGWEKVQPRGRAHGPGREPQFLGGEGLGQADLS